MKRAKFVIIDGHALIHRAYHAIPPLTTKNGEMVNAVYGFTSMLLGVLKELKPEYLALAMDLPGGTFRHEEYKEYKATRQKADDELISQFPLVREVADAFSIPIFERQGYEADDVIGSMAKELSDRGDIETFIVTGDKDELQLVNETTKVYTMRRGFTDTVIYGEAEILEKYGLTPKEFIVFKALKGDPSDNIPGVPGVGEKTATELVVEYKTLDNMYENLSNIRPAVAKKLEDGKDLAYLSEKLSTIVTNLDLDLSLEKAKTHDFDRAKVYDIFRRFEFKSLLAKIPDGGEVDQTSLFDVAIEKPKTREHFTPDNYKLIDNEEELRKLDEELKKAKFFAIDTETDSTDEVSANLCGISVSCKEGKALYLPIAHQVEGKQLDFALVQKILGPVLADEKVAKTGHNIKYDYVVLKNHGLYLNGIVFDTMVAAFLVNPNARAQSLDDLAFSELGIETLKIEELIGKGAAQITFDHVALDKASLYAAEDADISLRLYHKLKNELDHEGFTKLMTEMEAPLIPVLGDMELAGVKVDTVKLAGLSTQFEKRISELEKEIFGISKEKFNINSPAQLQKVLYVDLNLQEKIENKRELKKLPSGGYSTGAEALELLRECGHKIIDLILEYRELTKLKNTYVDTLPQLVNPKTGRIHTNFNQTIAATGRLSSTNPNLQNIPIRTELGQEIRKAFIADEGYSIITADYSQIDLRVVTHLSGDVAFTDDFNHGRDIHATTAAKVYGIKESEVTKEQRRLAKVVNFGIVYGVSAHGLERQSDLTYAEAKDFIEKYFLAHPGIDEFMKKTVEEARKTGFAETLFGRRRYLPDLKSPNFNVRSGAERIAMNMPVQGTSADLIKLAMIDIQKDYKKICKDALMLLQIHDELVFEVPDECVVEFSKFVKERMENIVKLNIPIEANVGVGKNWGDAK